MQKDTRSQNCNGASHMAAPGSVEAKQLAAEVGGHRLVGRVGLEAGGCGGHVQLPPGSDQYTIMVWTTNRNERLIVLSPIDPLDVHLGQRPEELLQIVDCVWALCSGNPPGYPDVLHWDILSCRLPR